MKFIIPTIIILAYLYNDFRKKHVRSSDSQEMTKTQKMLSVSSFVILALIVSGVWGFVYGAAYQLYSFPKEHSFVFHIASLLIFIVVLEIMDFFRKKALKNILK